MNHNLFLVFSCVFFFVTAAVAGDKPEWAGNSLGKEALSPDYIDPGHAPIQVSGDTVNSGFKKMTLDKFGLPKMSSWKDFQILKYPVRLVFEDDRAQVRFREGKFSLEKVGKNAASGKAVFEAAGMRFEVDSRFDFDFTIRYRITVTPVKGAVTVKKLSLVFPMNTPHDEEKLVMYYAEGPDRAESGLEAQKRRVHLTIKGGDYRAVEPGFCSLFWIGTTNCGMSWNFESAKDWNPVKGNEMTYDPGTGNFMLNLIQKSTQVSKPLTYEFFLTPTPVKTMPENWRTWNYAWRGSPAQKIDRKLFNQLIYWSSTFRIDGGESFNNLWARDMDQLKEVAASDKGMHKAAYFIPQLITSQVAHEDEDGNVFVMRGAYLEELCRKYHRTPGMKGKNLDLPEDAVIFRTMAERQKKLDKNYFQKHKCTAKATTWDVVFAPQLADHMVYALNEFVKIGVGGIYYDGINPQQNYSDWAAWTDPEGVKRPYFHFGWQRELLKRMRAVVKKADPDEVIVAHQSGTRPASTLSLCDAIIPGETFFYWYHDPEKRDASQNGDFYYAHIVGDIDNLKGEFFYRQWGVPHILLPEIRGRNGRVFPQAARGTRTMLAHTLHFDMLYFPTMCDVNEIYKIYRIRNEFGMAGVEFVPYWENKLFRTDNKNIKASYYQKGGHYMLIVSNLQFSDAEFKVTLPKGITKVREMQRKTMIPVKDGGFSDKLPAYDFAIYEIGE